MNINTLNLDILPREDPSILKIDCSDRILSDWRSLSIVGFRAFPAFPRDALNQ